MAIIVSTVAFAALHVQYDWLGIVAVFAMGLYLGVVRYTDLSRCALTMFLHAVGNAFATLEIVILENMAQVRSPVVDEGRTGKSCAGSCR